MRKRSPWLILSVLGLGFATLTPAQPSPEALRRGREAVNERFEKGAPAIGELMPDLTVYDADGIQHSLQKLLREHYTVLVLGCLT
jgi:hypothetical protein